MSVKELDATLQKYCSIKSYIHLLLVAMAIWFFISMTIDHFFGWATFNATMPVCLFLICASIIVLAVASGKLENAYKEFDEDRSEDCEYAATAWNRVVKLRHEYSKIKGSRKMSKDDKFHMNILPSVLMMILSYEDLASLYLSTRKYADIEDFVDDIYRDLNTVAGRGYLTPELKHMPQGREREILCRQEIVDHARYYSDMIVRLIENYYSSISYEKDNL